MLKGGIFLDIENLIRNGGWNMRFDAIVELVAAQDVKILRPNAYLAADLMREESDPGYRDRKEGYRRALRRAGFRLVLKEVRWFTNDDGERVSKANADLDMAVDALTQSDHLDYVLLGTGDGDFVRLVRALQTRGKRVEVLAFGSVSRALREEADHFHPGLFLPGMFADGGTNGGNRRLGVLAKAMSDRGFGFIQLRTGLGVRDWEEVFCHLNDFEPGQGPVNLALLHRNETILEFEPVQSPKDGRLVARKIRVCDDEGRPIRSAPPPAAVPVIANRLGYRPQSDFPARGGPPRPFVADARAAGQNEFEGPDHDRPDSESQPPSPSEPDRGGGTADGRA